MRAPYDRRWYFVGLGDRVPALHDNLLHFPNLLFSVVNICFAFLLYSAALEIIPPVYLNLQLPLLPVQTLLSLLLQHLHQQKVEYDDGFGQNGSYALFLRSFCAHNLLDNDSNLNIHAVWRESPSIPVLALFPSVHNDNSGLDLRNLGNPVAYDAQSHLLVECLFHRNHEDQSRSSLHLL